jgi:hypothetical protein
MGFRPIYFLLVSLKHASIADANVFVNKHFDMDMSYAWVLLLRVAHRNLTVYVTRYGVRAHNVVMLLYWYMLLYNVRIAALSPQS